MAPKRPIDSAVEEVRKALDPIMQRFGPEYWRGQDALKTFPTEFFDTIGEAGYFGTFIPEAYGGVDAGARIASVLVEEINRAAVGKDPHLSLTRRNANLYVPTQNSNAVYVLDRFTLAQVDVLAVPGAHGAGMTFNGKYFYTTNLPGGGTEALFTIDTQTNSVIGDAVDSKYPVPHNIALTQSPGKLYLTHSGGTSDKVTFYDVSYTEPIPAYAGEVTVGLNPFGLAYVP